MSEQSDHGGAERVVVYVTTPQDQAAAIARALVEERLAACVNIVEARSIYSWKGEICDDPESLLVIKTRAERFEALRERVMALHPYDVAEVIALPLVAGSAPYLAWLDAAVTEADG